MKSSFIITVITTLAGFAGSAAADPLPDGILLEGMFEPTRVAQVTTVQGNLEKRQSKKSFYLSDIVTTKTRTAGDHVYHETFTITSRIPLIEPRTAAPEETATCDACSRSEIEKRDEPGKKQWLLVDITVTATNANGVKTYITPTRVPTTVGAETPSPTSFGVSVFEIDAHNEDLRAIEALTSKFAPGQPFATAGGPPFGGNYCHYFRDDPEDAYADEDALDALAVYEGYADCASRPPGVWLPGETPTTYSPPTTTPTPPSTANVLQTRDCSTFSSFCFKRNPPAPVSTTGVSGCEVRAACADIDDGESNSNTKRSPCKCSGASDDCHCPFNCECQTCNYDEDYSTDEKTHSGVVRRSQDGSDHFTTGSTLEDELASGEIPVDAPHHRIGSAWKVALKVIASTTTSVTPSVMATIASTTDVKKISSGNMTAILSNVKEVQVRLGPDSVMAENGVGRMGPRFSTLMLLGVLFAGF